MSSALFQASQIIPTKTQIRSRRVSSSSRSCSSMCPIRSRSLSVSTCGALPVREVSIDSVVDRNSLDVLLNGFRRASSSCDSDSGFALSWISLALSSSSIVYESHVKGDLRSGSIVTVKKPELVLSPKIQFDLSQKNQTKSPLETEAGGGSGDDGGDKGTSGGDGGGGDDDDYFFRNFDEGDDNGDDKHSGLFRRRFLVSEVFDKKSLDSVLREWKVTLNSLPLGIRLAYRMGLVSSAQLLRFLVINVRPTISRLISRAIPQSLSRPFMGRMIADPAFHYKLLFEQVASICCSVWWELEIRGKKRIKNEWDLALIKVFTISACNAFVVWSLAPCYSYENTSKSELQNLLQKLPNNIFEKGYRLRGFNMQNRILSFFYKAVEFFMVGLMAGAAQDALSTLAVKMKKKEGRFSALTMPRMSTSILGHGVFMGLNMNLRYQLLSGLDRALVSYFDVIGVALSFGTASRILNVQVGVKSLAYLEERGEDLVVRSWKKLSSKLGSSEDGALLPLMWVFERNVNESRHLIPIVASTGGLVDTVKEGFTGFQMGAFSVECDAVDPADVTAVSTTVKRALATYGTPAMTEMVRNCMAQDLSWKGPAKLWEKLLLNLEVAGIETGVEGEEIAPLAKENVATP